MLPKMASGSGNKANFKSKYLSPCRTFGLKRKSKSPLCRNPNNVFNNKEETHVLDSCENKKSSPRPSDNPILGDNLQTDTPKRMKFRTSSFESVTLSRTDIDPSVEPITSRNNEMRNSSIEEDGSAEKIPMKDRSGRRYSLNLSRKQTVHNGVGKKSLIDDRNDVEVPTDIMNTINRINEKCRRLQKLRNDKIYFEKHDINNLKASTEHWKRVCIDALNKLSFELRSGSDTSKASLSDLIRAHSISPELLSFNVENNEFV